MKRRGYLNIPSSYIKEKMEKIEVKISPRDLIVIPFGEGIVKITPYITLGNKMVLLKNYIETITDEDLDLSMAYLKAEYALVLGILDFNTSVKIDGSDIEDLVVSGLWDKVKEKIENYQEFRNQISEAYCLVKNKDNSWKYIFEYISMWVDSQLNSDKFKELSDQFKVQKKELDKVYPTIQEQSIADLKKVSAKRPRKAKVSK